MYTDKGNAEKGKKPLSSTAKGKLKLSYIINFNLQHAK